MLCGAPHRAVGRRWDAAPAPLWLPGCAPHLILCPTPHPVPHTSSCAPHLVLCPTPHSVPHTSFCAPHLVLCPTPHFVPAQLLGQLENTGPPPADKEKISSLPTVAVTQDQVGGCPRSGGVREARVLLVRAAASPPSPGGGARGAGRTRRAASERRSPPGAPQTRGWSARCARRTTRWPSRCGSCRATTSSTAAASCPGWSW